MLTKIKKNQSALSLIEIIVAFTILSSAFIALIHSFPLGLSVNKEAENSTISAYLAQEKIEELISLSYDNIEIGVVETKNKLSEDMDNYLYNFQRETEVYYIDGDLNESDIDLGMKKLSVTVYYINPVGKKEKAYNITTILAKK